MTTSNRRRTANCAAALLTFCLAGCGLLNSGPAGVVKGFFAAVDHNDLDRAVKMFASPVRQMIGDGKLKAGLEAASKDMQIKGGMAGVTVDEEKIDGDHATVSVTIRYKNGSTSTEKSKLVKEKDGWKLDASK